MLTLPFVTINCLDSEPEGKVFVYEIFMMFRFDMNLFDFSNIFKGENANKVKENEEKKEKSPTKSPKKEEEVLKVSSKEFKKK